MNAEHATTSCDQSQCLCGEELQQLVPFVGVLFALSLLLAYGFGRWRRGPAPVPPVRRNIAPQPIRRNASPPLRMEAARRRSRPRPAGMDEYGEFIDARPDRHG